VRRFPYLVMYVVDHESIEVAAIAHAKRSPGYWRNR
jgi:toxin ParE1/3/4